MGNFSRTPPHLKSSTVPWKTLPCTKHGRRRRRIVLLSSSDQCKMAAMHDFARPLPCYLVPSSRIRPLATAVAAPLHPALSLAYRLMVLMVAPLENPMSVSSHLCLGLPLLLAPFILPSITSSSIPTALTTCPK